MTKLRKGLALSAIVLAALLLLVGALEIARRSTAASLEDQRAALRWSEGGSTQLSCFFASGSGYDASRENYLKRRIDEALSAASLAAEPGGRLWYHALSGEGSLYGSTTRGGVSLRVTAFAGEYFYIHQPTLLSGSYLSPGGGNAGYIFLDENAAWQLFGAIDIAGMPMTLSGHDYIVCGVGAAPSGTLYDEAYGDIPRAWILTDSPAGGTVTEMNAYEAILPNPITDFARGILEKEFPPSDTTVIVENTTRFGYGPLYESIAARPRMGVRLSPVVYPWWENIAQVTEYRCATLLLLETISLSLALLLLLIWIGIFWNPAGRALKRGWIRAKDAVEEGYNNLTRPKPKKKRRRVSPGPSRIE